MHEAEAFVGEEAVDDPDQTLVLAGVAREFLQGRQGRGQRWVGRYGWRRGFGSGGERREARAERRVVWIEADQLLGPPGGVGGTPESLGQVCGQAERLREAALATA